MKIVFLVGCSLKEQIRIKGFLKGKYLVLANPSVSNSLKALASEPVDVLIYDTGNAVPLPFFIEQMPSMARDAPLVALSGTTAIKVIEKMMESGVDSIIKKPCNKSGLIKGIEEGLAKWDRPPPEEKSEEPPPPKEPTQPVYIIRKAETDVLIGLRKQAVITRIGSSNVRFLLPASLETGATMLFRNAEFLNLIGLHPKSQQTLEITVSHCSKISEFQYQVDAEFSGELMKILREPLKKFVGENSVTLKMPSSSKTVILAEEDTFTRGLFSSYLMEQGYQVLEASNGFEALEIIEKDSADLLICDLLLKKLSGKEIISLLKGRNNLIPIIVVTGEANPRVVKEIGPMVQAILIKPTDGENLVAVVAKTFEEWQDQASAVASEEGERVVEVNLQTDLMVAFRDPVKLVAIGPKGLTFSRAGPIAPDTMIFAKTNAIAISHHGTAKPVQSLELKVARCRLQEGSSTYLVEAEFLSDANAAG